MEVVHEGTLEIGSNPDSKSSKDWKSRLFVLKRHPVSGRSSLDFYKSTSKRWQKQSIMGVLSLWPSFDISIAHQCPYKFTLKLTTTECLVYLACSSLVSMSKWLFHIQTQRILEPSRDTYFYNVVAKESNAMNQIGVFGNCQLALTPSFEIVCAILPSRQVAAVWPLDCLRNFSYGNGVFSFEAGRHSPRGPGEYNFTTKHDQLIHSQLVKLIERARRNSTSSISPNRLSSMMDNRPPAQLPVRNPDSSSDSRENSDTDELQLASHNHNNIVSDNEYTAPPQTPPQVLSPKHTTPPPLPECPPPKIPPKVSSVPDSMPAMDQSLNIPVKPNVESSVPNGSGESGDHVYSHTMHSNTKNPPNTVDDPLIYNSLVHDKPAANKKFTGYEMVYPDGKAPQPPVAPDSGTSNVVYDTAYNETDGHQKPPLLATIPSATQLMGPSVSDSGMTANPLYGSKGNLLEDIMSKQMFDSSVGSIPPTPGGSSPPIPPKPRSLSTSPESPKQSHPDITSNPVYVSSNIKEERTTSTPQPVGNSNGHSSGGAARYRSTLLNNTHSHKENIPESDPTPSATPAKGYSQVNKLISESLQESFIPGSMDSDPPPIPDRIGSYEDD